MDVKDKTVVVTGGGRGIGEALCRRFAREVIVADVNGANARAVAGRIGGATAVCDVGREEDLQHLVGESEESFGPIDLFCSNAGVMARGGIEAPDEGWQRLWTVNVMSHVYASRAMIPRMVDRGGWCLADNGVRSGAVEPDRVDAVCSQQTCSRGACGISLHRLRRPGNHGLCPVSAGGKDRDDHGREQRCRG